MKGLFAKGGDRRCHTSRSKRDNTDWKEKWRLSRVKLSVDDKEIGDDDDDLSDEN